MDLRKLKTLIDLVAESTIEELEVTEGENKVRILKSSPHRQPPTMLPQAQQTLHANPTTGITPPVPLPDDVVAAEDLHEGHVVTSPLVGTFYRASSPESPAFVEMGSQVKVGETLGIIEAMKLLNPIESDSAGVIKKILVENGQPVEYGQPLFVIQ